MNIKFFELLFFIVLIQKCVFSQDFLEVKYSIKDIIKQRDNFKNEKIKSVTVKDNFAEAIYQIDKDGKILNKTVAGENSATVTYNYSDNNLISIIATSEGRNYNYDPIGNVITSFDASSSSNYFYDTYGKLIKIESFMESEEGEGVVGPDKIIYNEDLVIEVIYPISMGLYERTVFEYSEDKKLTKVENYESIDADNIGKIRNTEEYFYNSNSKFPYRISWTGKVINNGNEIESSTETIITYEYYE